MFRIRNFSRTKPWVKITTIGLSLVLLGALVWTFVVTPLISCGPDVERVDDQCIGVTDGRVMLNADLAGVLDKIRQENERVEQEDERVESPASRSVSIAYLLPLPKASDRPADVSRLRHELEGAHIAQLQANQTKTLGEEPLVRLLVANPGDQSSQWQRVVPALLAKVEGPERLVTVVATGKTLSGTVEAIDALRSGGVPVVTSRLAGDSLTKLNPEALAVRGGLARMASPASDQAAAAAAYLKPSTSRALIVRDENPADIFLKSVDEGFRKAFEDDTHMVVEPSESYNSQFGGVANAMSRMLRNICQQEPDVILFAGRSSALESFVQALPRRPCLEVPIRVMGHGDTVDFATIVALGGPELREGLNANASVIYTAQTHPDSWEASPEIFPSAATRQLSSTCDQCLKNVFPGETLEDTGAIMGYDAIVTAVAAVRPDQGAGINDTPDLVSQEFKRLHDAGAVPGASGWISLDPLGKPVNKATVILQVESDGALKFVQVSSALGTPCVPDVSPC